MPTNILMYVRGDAGRLSKIFQCLKMTVCRDAKARVFFEGREKAGNRLLIEIVKGKTVENKISHLLKILSENRDIKMQLVENKISATISVACLALRKEVEIIVSPKVLRRMVEMGVNLEIVAFSMNKAKSYRDGLIAITM